jgi:hypothetical protein
MILRQRISESAGLFLVTKCYWDDEIKGSK